MMNDQLAALAELTRKRDRWKRISRALFFTQIGLDLAVAPLNPLALAHAAVAVGQYTASAKLGNPADPHNNSAVGALVHQGRQQLALDPSGDPRPPSLLDRLAATVFDRA